MEHNGDHALLLSREQLGLAMPFTVFLLAGTATQAEHYARAFLNPQQAYTYIEQDGHNLRGMSHIRFLPVGTFRERSDLTDVMEMLATRPGTVRIVVTEPLEGG